MVIDKICKITYKGVKSKSENFFSISHGVFELWRKTLEGPESSPLPGMDRVNAVIGCYRNVLSFSFVMGICNFVRLDMCVLVIFEYFLEVLGHWRFFKSYF